MDTPIEEASEGPSDEEIRSAVRVSAHECQHVCVLCGAPDDTLQRVKDWIKRQRDQGHLRGPVAVFADELLNGLGLE